MKTLQFFLPILCLAMLPFYGSAQGITVGSWQIHHGLDQEPIAFTNNFNGDPRAYSKANIPPKDDLGWSAAPLKEDKVHLVEQSKLTQCKRQLDFTYFQTNVFVPANAEINEFSVFYDKADDGARIYFFNSKHPNGHFDSEADLILNRSEPTDVNLVGELAKGENNRVVIVQFDDCPTQNNISGINIKVNGEVIEPTEPACPSYELVGHWTFDGANPKQDLTGNFGDLVLTNAAIKDGALDVGQNAYARGQGYQGMAFVDKTLMAWVKVDAMTPRGGSVLTVDKTGNVDEFDAIVFGEWNEGQWIAGSSYYRRSQGPGAAFRETETGKLVKVTITYKSQEDGKCAVKVYREGELINEYVKGTCPEFKNDTEVLFGVRHMVGNRLPGNPFCDTKIEEARVYDGAMCAEDIKNATKTPPSRFRLHAYSINGKRVDKGSDYWIGWKKDDSSMKGFILNSNAGNIMEVERITVDAAHEIVALKVVNAGPDMYLTVLGNGQVFVKEGMTEGAKFRIRPPEEKESANLNYLSFESVYMPNHFLRHQGYVLKVTEGTEANRKSIVYRQDASWLFEPLPPVR